MNFTEWRKIKLKDCAKFQEGYVNPSQTIPEYFGNEIKWLRANDLNNSYVYDTSRKLSQKGFESAGKSAFLFKPNSLAISKSGTIGRLGILKDFMCGNRAVINIETDDSICDNLFIFYSLLFRQKLIEEMGSGSVQKNLYISVLGDLEIDLPPLSIQRRIANILSALDDKIELNRQTNATLEAIAQAIFKEWFVDFNFPSGLGFEGLGDYRDYAAARLSGESLNQANHGTDMVKSELGLIPRGWRVGKLEDIATVIMGLSPTGDSYNSDQIGIPLINGPVEFGEYFPLKTKWTTTPTRMAEAGDLIFCVRGSTTGRRVVADDSYCIGRGVCAIRAKNGTKVFLYQTINSGIENMLTKTTGSVFPSLSAPDIKGFQILLPPWQLIQQFEKLSEPLKIKIETNLHESTTLAQLRDSLLPKLLNGQMGV